MAQDDILAYLRKSSACVRSFLLLAALKYVLYDERQIAEVMCQMLDSSRLAERFPVARGQLVKLLKVLHPRTRLFLEDLAACNMHVLCMAASIPDDDQAELQAASLQLSPSTMGNLLVHAFDAIQTETGNRSIELSGSTGLSAISPRYCSGSCRTRSHLVFEGRGNNRRVEWWTMETQKDRC